MARANWHSATTTCRHPWQRQQWPAVIADCSQMPPVVSSEVGGGEQRLPTGTAGSVSGALSQGVRCRAQKVHVYLRAPPTCCQCLPILALLCNPLLLLQDSISSTSEYIYIHFVHTHQFDENVST